MCENLNQQKIVFLQASPRAPAPCHDDNDGASDDDDDDDCDDDCLQELPSPLSLPPQPCCRIFSLLQSIWYVDSNYWFVCSLEAIITLLFFFSQLLVNTWMR